MALLGPLAALGAWAEAAGLPYPFPWRLLALWSLAATVTAPIVWVWARSLRPPRAW